MPAVSTAAVNALMFLSYLTSLHLADFQSATLFPLLQVHLFPTEKPTSQPVLVQARTAGLQYFVAHHQGSLLLLTNLGSTQEYQLMTAPVCSPGMTNWQTAVPHRRGVAITDMDVFATHAVLYERHHGRPAISLFSLPLQHSIHPPGQLAAASRLNSVTDCKRPSVTAKGGLDCGSIGLAEVSHWQPSADSSPDSSIDSHLHNMNRPVLESSQLSHHDPQSPAKQKCASAHVCASKSSNYCLHAFAGVIPVHHNPDFLRLSELAQLRNSDSQTLQQQPSRMLNQSNGEAPYTPQQALQHSTGQLLVHCTQHLVSTLCNRQGRSLQPPAHLSTVCAQQNSPLQQQTHSYATDAHTQQGEGGLKTVHLPDWAMSVEPGGNPDYHSGTVRLHLSSPVHPQHVYDCHLQTGKLQLLEVQQVTSHDPKDYVCVMQQALSHDGTQVSKTVAVQTCFLHASQH